MKGLSKVNDLADQAPTNHDIDGLEVHMNNISLAKLQ